MAAVVAAVVLPVRAPRRARRRQVGRRTRRAEPDRRPSTRRRRRPDAPGRRDHLPGRPQRIPLRRRQRRPCRRLRASSDRPVASCSRRRGRRTGVRGRTTTAVQLGPTYPLYERHHGRARTATPVAWVDPTTAPCSCSSSGRRPSRATLAAVDAGRPGRPAAITGDCRSTLRARARRCGSDHGATGRVDLGRRQPLTTSDAAARVVDVTPGRLADRWARLQYADDGIHVCCGGVYDVGGGRLSSGTQLRGQRLRVLARRRHLVATTFAEGTWARPASTLPRRSQQVATVAERRRRLDRAAPPGRTRATCWRRGRRRRVDQPVQRIGATGLDEAVLGRLHRPDRRAGAADPAAGRGVTWSRSRRKSEATGRRSSVESLTVFACSRSSRVPSSLVRHRRLGGARGRRRLAGARRSTTTQEESEFLPDHYESIQAARLQEENFPGATTPAALHRLRARGRRAAHRRTTRPRSAGSPRSSARSSAPTPSSSRS